MRWLHWLLHNWATCKDTGKTVYQQCKLCGKRRAWQRWPGIGHQPINERWVNGLVQSLETDYHALMPPRGGSGTAPPMKQHR